MDRRRLTQSLPAALLGAVLALACTVPAVAASAEALPVARPVAFGVWGIDLNARDTRVKAGDDFFRYAIGTWTRTATLPSDRTRWGAFDMLAADAEQKVHVILDELAAAHATRGSVEQKVGDFHAAFLDESEIARRKLQPARAGLAAIAAARSHDDVVRLMARPDLALPGPIAIGISLDQKNPNRYAVIVTHAGLGLPEREYYLRDDAQFKEIRAQYVAHIQRLLKAGQASADPAGAAQRILALETDIARLHWPIAKRRERDLNYNARSLEELRKLAPAFPWDASLVAAGLRGTHEVIVRELDAMGPLAELFKSRPVAVWRDYLTYHYLRAWAPVLPQALDAEVFDFFGHTLNGQPEQKPRWKRSVAAADAAVGEAIGQIYVQRHFPPQAKAQVLQIVENLRRAFGTRIQSLPWMSAATKAAAVEKLATFRPKIGYPDRWRDYSQLEVRRDDAFGNARRAALFDWQHDLERLGKPADRDEWFMTPQTVNAYYNPVFNEVVFPAAILQPPFFDPNADAAVNYGAIGAVIGHEMGHGFDDQGAKSDARGVLRTWWSAADEESFHRLAERLADQYAAFEPLPGLKVNGRLTLGENIGDLGGLTVAHEAYQLSLAGQAAPPPLDGYSGEQRFFLGWAQVWRSLIREQRLRTQIMSDPHSPPEFRVNGVVRNMDAWYAAFDVQPGDRLYLPPEERVRIW
jgi:putative endopeptidase